MPATRRFDRERVAAIVLESLELSLPPVTTVATVMGVSTNQARHMVRRTRREGHLGAGGHEPTRATIHRGSTQMRHWLVCQSCLNAWPCPSAFPKTPESEVPA